MTGKRGIPTVPGRVERLLARLLSRHRFGQDLLGDLAEEHAARAASGRGRGADLWYLWEASRVVAFTAPRHLWRRVRSPVRFLSGFRSRFRLRDPARSAPGRRPRRRASSQETAMGQLLFDLRLAFRSLARRPGLTLVMVSTLAIGLGVNAAIFGVLDALVFHPFSFPEVDRLVHLREVTAEEDFDRANLAPGTFLDLRRDTAPVVEALVGYEWWNANLMGADGVEKLVGYKVSFEYFDALRARPALGRLFLPEEGESGRSAVVVLGHDLWQKRFAADPSVLGRSLDIDGTAYTVIGVAARGVAIPEGAQMWSPLVFAPAAAAVRDQRYLGALGRLRSGVTLEEARSAISALGDRLAAEHPRTQAGRRLRTDTLTVALRDPGSAPVLGLLQAAAGFVLLIGCLNLANLILARGAERQRELAILDALGAGRARLLRLLIAEGALLGFGAALLSLPIAAIGLRFMRDAMPADIRRFIAGWEELGLDARVLAVTALLALVAVVTVSVWPALRASRAGGLLRLGGRGRTAGAGAQRGRSALVVGEIALGLALLVAAGLSVRGAHSMLNGPVGFRSDHLLTLRLTLPENRYPDGAARLAFARRAEERLAALPGAEQVTVASILPATGNNHSLPIAIEGEPEPDPAQPRSADLRAVAPSYFGTLGFQTISGRLLAATDTGESTAVAVVSRSMAERFWPGRDPLGLRFRAGDLDTPWITVVGVVSDHVHHWFGRRNYPTYFRPFAQLPRTGFSLAVRTRGEPEALVSDVRRALHEVDPAQPIFDVRSMRESLENSTIGLQYVAALLAIFAGIALILAASGIYAVMAYRVSLRTAEIGVRLALGASARDIWGMIMGQALRMTTVGLVIGLGLSLFVSRALIGVLQGVVRADPTLFAVGVGVLAFAAVAASWFPTRRALGVEPADILRRE